MATRTEDESASIGCQGMIRKVGTCVKIGSDSRDQDEMLDNAVRNGRCWIEVTEANVELCIFRAGDPPELGRNSRAG